MRLIRIVTIFIAFGLALPLHAQNATSPLTAEQAVALAVAHNPRVDAAANDILAAQTGVKSARSLANPEITFTPAISGPGGSDTELLVQQPLEINGSRQARTGVAQAQVRVVRAGAVIELSTLVFQTKSAFYELLRAREAQDVAGALLQSAQEFDQITRRQVEAGSRPGVDQVQTGIEFTRARQQVTQASRQVAIAEASLNNLLGNAPSVPVGPLSPIPTTIDLPQDDAAIAQALAARGEIQQEQANRDVFLQQARQARAEGVPDLAPQYRATSVTRGGVQDSGIGIGVTLPILDYGGRRNRIRQSEQSARAQEARVETARNQVRQEVTQALAQLKAANQIIGDYQQGVLDQAKQLLEASRTGFKEGQTSIVSVLEAQRTYRSVQTDYNNALVDAAIARAELERATGVVSPDLLSRVNALSK